LAEVGPFRAVNLCGLLIVLVLGFIVFSVLCFCVWVQVSLQQVHLLAAPGGGGIEDYLTGHGERGIFFRR
jgi:hypothetical protein